MSRWFQSAARRMIRSRNFLRRARLTLTSLERREVPANLLVTTNADSGAGSLRAALIEASSGTRPGLDSITFDPSVVGTITLATPLDVTSDVLIIGPGAGQLTVSGNKLTRVFTVSDSASTSITAGISGLAIKDGSTVGDGAGISVGQNDLLTLTSVYVTGNSAGGNGGAIFLTDGGDLTVLSSTISANSSGNLGGAIYFSGTAIGGSLEVRNSTVSGNSALQGGGVALANFTGDFALSNSTLVQNNATAGSGGGILRTTGSGTVSVVSSIVFGNTTSAPSGADVSTAGTVLYRKSDLGNSSGIGTLTDQGGNLAVGTNPTLTILSYNGGQMPTHALIAGSPAIDKGINPPVSLPNDVRGPGYTRSFGTTDIGAFEVATANTPTASGSFADITTTGAPTATFQIIYTDDFAINVNTLATGQDISVTGPNGYSVWATFISVDNNTYGTPRVATYQIPAPGGAWDATDNGVYTVTMAKNAVYDNSALSVPAGDIGQMRVAASIGYYVVTNNNDSGAGSLRNAIALANASTGSHDIVQFDPGFFNVSRTITLTSGEINITDPLTIQGTGSNMLFVSGNNASRIFNISDNVASSIAVEIDAMTIMAGSSASQGGAIVNADESLSLINVVMSSNRSTGSGLINGGGAIAITGAGSLYALNTVFSSNQTTGAGADGGAIRAADGSVVTLDTCYVTGNSANGHGGGLYISGKTTASSLVVISTTISNNRATDLAGDGGGIFFTGTVGGAGFAIRNSTLSGNVAAANGGGIGMNAFNGVLQIQSSTITNNAAGSASRGGGVSQIGGTGNVCFSSTVISGNANAKSPDVYTTTQATFIRSALGSKAGIANFVDGGNNLPIGVALNLGALINNGGFAPTHLPDITSLLVDRGANPTGSSTDQRGFTRTSGIRSDIGAVEAVSPGNPIAIPGGFADVTTSGGTNYSFTVTYEDDAAILAASLDNADTRVVGPNGFNVLAIAKSVDTPGDGSPRTVTYEFTAPGGQWDGADAGLYTVSLEANQVSDTSANKALAVTLGSFAVNLSRTFVVTNNADSGAGSLRDALATANLTSAADTITFEPTYFSTVRTIALTSGELAVSQPVAIQGTGMAKLIVSGNNASRIFNVNDGNSSNSMAVTLSGMKLTGGKSSTDGAAIYLFDEALTLTNVDVSGNSSTTGASGAIYVADVKATLSLDSSVVSANSTGAGASGGGIRVDGAATVSIYRSTISGNVASNRGGGIYFNNGGSLTIVDSTISGNTASIRDGGGVYFFGPIGSGGLTIRNSTFSSNVAANSGGGIALVSISGIPVIQNSTLTNNKATTGFGGGIARLAGTNTINMTSTIVAGNSANLGTDWWFNSATGFVATNNLIGVTDDSNVTVTGTNLTGTTTTPLNAMLAPLANNGGPNKTHALLPGSPAIDAGVNVAALPFDARGTGYVRVFGSSADIGAVELQPGPAVAGIFVNDGSAQRSMVKSLTVTFSTLMNFASNNVPGAFVLERMNGVTPVGTVTLTASTADSTPTQTIVKLTFSGAQTEASGSLVDGQYRLTILADNVTDNLNQHLDGDGNGSNGDSFVSSTGAIHRLFGDSNGDATVNQIDYNAIRLAFLMGPSVAFDFNGDGNVDQLDFNQFRLRYNTSV